MQFLYCLKNLSVKHAKGLKPFNKENIHYKNKLIDERAPPIIQKIMQKVTGLTRIEAMNSIDMLFPFDGYLKPSKLTLDRLHD